jgi:hypothetical protein
MPEISYFYGIRVYINFKEHNPPHFHADYGEYTVLVYLDGWVVEGKFPKRALEILLERQNCIKKNLWWIGIWQWQNSCRIKLSL